MWLYVVDHRLTKDLRVQIEFCRCIEFLRESEFILMFNDAHTCECFQELFRNRCFLHDLAVILCSRWSRWLEKCIWINTFLAGNLIYLEDVCKPTSHDDDVVCVRACVCSIVMFFNELCNWVVHFGSQTTTKEWTPCRLGQSECLLNRHQVGTEEKRYRFVSLNFGQKVTWPGGAWVGSGSNQHNPFAVVSYVTCSKFLPTNEHIENNRITLSKMSWGVTHYRGFHKEDFLHDETLPNDQGSDFAQGFGHEVSCRKRDCGRGASANSTEMIGLMSILQHLSNVCSTEKPVKRSTHVCDSEGLWGEYVFDKQLGCTNKTHMVEIVVWPDRLICPNSLACWCVHDSKQ